MSSLRRLRFRLSSWWAGRGAQSCRCLGVGAWGGFLPATPPLGVLTPDS